MFHNRSKLASGHLLAKLNLQADSQLHQVFPGKLDVNSLIRNPTTWVKDAPHHKKINGPGSREKHEISQLQVLIWVWNNANQSLY